MVGFALIRFLWRKKWWIIAGVLIAIVLLGSFLSLSQPPAAQPFYFPGYQ